MQEKAGWNGFHPAFLFAATPKPARQFSLTLILPFQFPFVSCTRFIGAHTYLKNTERTYWEKTTKKPTTPNR
jgi:hypothetical protein